MGNIKNIACIVLAAGKGTRMKSRLPKALHALLGRPIISRCLDNLKNFKKALVVVAPKQSTVTTFLKNNYRNIKIVYQTKQLGSGHAVACAEPLLKSFHGHILVLYVDNPLFKSQTFKRLIQHHLRTGASCTLATTVLENPTGYGRIIRDDKNRISRIAEENDCLDYQRQIKEINSGLFCFKKDKLFEALKEVSPDNKKKEFYLTDVVRVLADKEENIQSITLDDIEEAQGINSPEDLIRANEILRQRILKTLTAEGVTIVDVQSAHIASDAKIGQGSIINPFCVIEEDVRIGKNCIVGPFCHLRSGTVIKDNVTVGNFTEIVRSRLGSRTLMKHLSYIGDCYIGSRVNIGAGTVTANFDGRNKNKTYIGDRTFIGSDTVLVAPVKVGKGVTTGAGCVVLAGRNIPNNKTVVGVPARVIGKK